MEDVKVGALLRTLRRRRGLRQSDLAAAAELSQASASRAEHGHLDRLSLRAVRRLFAAVDAQADLEPRFQGAEVDRVADAPHAALVATAAAILRGWGWVTFPEVTFSVYGERGSIDLLALHEAAPAAVMLEAKTEVASAEETQRRMDVKTRLMPGIVFQREGWRPRSVARILAIGENRTNRRRVERLEVLFADSLPSRNVAVRRWLQAPAGSLAGIWFLSLLPGQDGMRSAGGKSRIRVARPPGPGVPVAERLNKDG